MASELRPFGEMFAEPTRNGLTRPKSVRGAGVKMVNMGELFAHSILRNVPMERVPLTGAEAERFLLKTGDLLFARQSLVLEGAGKCSIFLDGDEPVTFESHVTRVRLDPAKADPRFCFYLLKSPHGRAAIRSIVEQGAGASGIRGSDLATLELMWLPLDEQRVAARILGALDDKIELNRRMNETLEEMARALFKSWFVDFDPVRANAEGCYPDLPQSIAALFPSEFVNTPTIGMIPKGWRSTTLGVEVERWGGGVQTGPFGSQLHASDYVPEGVPVVMPQDIRGRRVSTEKIARVREFDAVRLSRHRLRVGDIVFSRRGNVELHGLIGPRENGWLCGTGCLLVRPGRACLSPVFLSFALDLPQTRAWISQHAIGATMPNLNTGILSAVPLVVPPEELLQAFSKKVEAIDRLMVINANQCETLAQLRDALLPKLISGELRVAGSFRGGEN